MHKSFVKARAVPLLLLLALSMPPSRARAVDLQTVAIVSSCGVLVASAATLALRAGFNRRKKAPRSAVVDYLLRYRSSPSASLRALVDEILQIHPGDLEMFAFLLSASGIEEAQLEARLKWHLARLKSKDQSFEQWLDFEELATTRVAWKSLQTKGWTVRYLDSDREFGGSDHMFVVQPKKRIIGLRTVPYLNSGPVVAAWAVWSADAAEKIFTEHKDEVQAWALSKIGERSKAFSAREVLWMADSISLYLQKAASWKKMVPLYGAFRENHPVHFSRHWEIHSHLSSQRDRNLHVLTTMSALVLSPVFEILSESIEEDLDSILVQPQ